ncbi:glycosyltransferase family protein [Qipengyuania sphaerica]|uniref:glycosyltransferase family protein n=1 Tax=Qipengyuania sphaerica TaxID=2867243 RepID=UPI001C88C979|nr:glycosyltransferase [Qipengyuania sphaerica]MBX7539819.1 glycosyltransferase [Qipengyuania sphaerica]
MSEVQITKGERMLDTPAPVRFVHNDRFGAQEAIASEDFGKLLEVRPDILRSFAENGDLCWTVQTWCRLRDMDVGGIEIATRPAEGRINLAKSKTLSRSGANPALFQVSIQADYPRILWAQFHIQQNADQLCEDSALQYLWPQAGIIPRDPDRRGVKRVGFLGSIEGNLASSVDDWSQLLARRGIEFVARDPSRWHDFSDLDVVIGLRSFGHSRHSRKPANKLINAWIAGVPFIGGSDSAYSQAGTAGVDHLLAHNREEVASQVDRLCNHPELYDELVEAGRHKTRKFSIERLASQWVGMLEGPIAARYREWEANLSRERRRTRIMGTAQSAIDIGKSAARKLLGRNTEA